MRKGCLRAPDICGIFGGEVFLAILPETSEVEAAERLRKEIATIPIPTEREDLHVTASFGVAEYPEAMKDHLGLLHTVDTPLYTAKGSGRNRVCTTAGISTEV